MNKMHQAGYYHGDLHLKNIMAKDQILEGDQDKMADYYAHNYRYYLIDFGLSGKLPNYTGQRRDLATMWDGVMDAADGLFDNVQKRELENLLADLDV